MSKYDAPHLIPQTSHRGAHTALGALALLLIAVPASGQSVQYRSPAGVEYRAQNDTGPVARAQKVLAENPKDVANVIQMGVAQSGARQFREAIATFTQGLSFASNDLLLYRWRGHRFLSVREVYKAIADLHPR